MPSWILLLILVIIIFLVLVAVKAQQKGGEAGFHYLPAKTLFTAAERSFLGVLDQVVGAEYRVFGKVRVADVVTIKPGLSKSVRQGALNRVAFKHFDYVICRASDLAVVCVVELNDKSHASARAQSRDALVRKVCEGIQLPLLTITAKASYNVEAIRTQFNAAISPPVLNSARNTAEFTF